MSGGEYVSMGYFEKYDVKAVVDYLHTLINIERLGIFFKKSFLKLFRIFLWGKSMGGAAILLYLSEFSPKISAICIDSCFSDLTTLLHDFSCKYLTSVIILKKTGSICFSYLVEFLAKYCRNICEIIFWRITNSILIKSHRLKQ